MKICVFCASSQKVGEPYRSAVKELGLEIGHRGHDLVFGGYDTGLMGEIAHAVREAGGKVYGVVPDDVSDFKSRKIFEADELFEVLDIQLRKRQMEELADAYIAAPGSFGTLDELYEVLVQMKIGGRSKAPAFLFNVDGFFDLFVQEASLMIEKGFMGKDDLELFEICNDPQSLMNSLERQTTH